VERNRTGWTLTRRHRANRSPNAVDQYSLFLQMIQVFPVISSVVVLIFSNAWLAKMVSGILLVGGTALVVALEYGGERRRRGLDVAARSTALAHDAGPEPLGEAHADHPETHTRVVAVAPEAQHVVMEDGGQRIVISIQVHSAPSANPPRRRRRRPPSEPVT
jgi:hypothetical protein